MPITIPMRVLTSVRLGLVVAMSCVVLAGCGGDDASTEAAKPPRTSDAPGYSGHPDLPALSSLSPTERLDLTVGTEANPKVFNEVASVVHAYLDARAEGDWESACSYMSPSGRRLLEGSAEREGEGDATCPTALPRQITVSLDELQREAALADVGSVRISGSSEMGQATYRIGKSLRVIGVSAVSGPWGLTRAEPTRIG